MADKKTTLIQSSRGSVFSVFGSLRPAGRSEKGICAKQSVLPVSFGKRNSCGNEAASHPCPCKRYREDTKEYQSSVCQQPQLQL